MTFKYFTLLCVIIFLVFNFSSCLVVNQTKHTVVPNADKCQVHHVKMNKRIVKTTFGRFYDSGNKPEYLNAKREASIGCCKPLWPMENWAVIYVCAECNKVKKEMTGKH